jgi:PhnB protein
MNLTPYLFFKDTCEEALKFYEHCGLGKVETLNRYDKAPPESDMGPKMGAKIMHARFKGPGVYFMASDSPRQGDGAFAGFSLSPDPATIAEAERLYDALAEGGVATMPLKKQFWGATFGMLTDKFGVHWMINCEAA